MPTCCCSWCAPEANSQLIGGGWSPPPRAGCWGEALRMGTEPLLPCPPSGDTRFDISSRTILPKNTLHPPTVKPEHRFCPLYSRPSLLQTPRVSFLGVHKYMAAYECLYPHTPCHGARRGSGQSSLSQPPRPPRGHAVAFGGLRWPSGRPSAQPASGPGRRAAASPGG